MELKVVVAWLGWKMRRRWLKMRGVFTLVLINCSTLLAIWVNKGILLFLCVKLTKYRSIAIFFSNF